MRIDFNIPKKHLASAVSHLLKCPKEIKKRMFRRRENKNHENRGEPSIPVDIYGTHKEYIFEMDLPGLSKSDVQVTVEDEETLVISSDGKRKREDCEEEGCKYLKLERGEPQKIQRRFELSKNVNVNGITAKCENGVLTINVEKLPPRPNRVEVITIS